MQHFEKMFLLEEAFFLWDQTLDAEKDGDVFVASETFVELNNHTLAKARIARPGEGEEPVLALILQNVSDHAALAEAAAFFEKGYEVKFQEPKTADWVFISKHIPPRLRPVQDPGGNK